MLRMTLLLGANLFLTGEFRGLRYALHGSAAAGRVDQGSLKFLQSQCLLVLLKQQVSELFARRNNRSRRNRKLLDCVLVVGGCPQQSHRVTRFFLRLRRPRHDFAPQNPHLGGPIVVACTVKLIFKFLQAGDLRARFGDAAAAGESHAASPNCNRRDLGRSCCRRNDVARVCPLACVPLRSEPALR